MVVSHENDRYHSHLGQIIPPFEVVRALELPAEGKVIRGIRFEAVPRVRDPGASGGGQSDDCPFP